MPVAIRGVIQEYVVHLKVIRALNFPDKQNTSFCETLKFPSPKKKKACGTRLIYHKLHIAESGQSELRALAARVHAPALHGAWRPCGLAQKVPDGRPGEPNLLHMALSRARRVCTPVCTQDEAQGTVL